MKKKRTKEIWDVDLSFVALELRIVCLLEGPDFFMQGLRYLICGSSEKRKLRPREDENDVLDLIRQGQDGQRQRMVSPLLFLFFQRGSEIVRGGGAGFFRRTQKFLFNSS